MSTPIQVLIADLYPIATVYTPASPVLRLPQGMHMGVKQLISLIERSWVERVEMMVLDLV